MKSLGQHYALAALALAVYATTLLMLSSARAPHWPRPAEVSDAQVADAVRSWLSQCAAAQVANPENCPQSAEDDLSPQSTSFSWQPGDSLVDGLEIQWSEALGLFQARGQVNMTYRHDRKLTDGQVAHYRGRAVAPFSAGLRWAGDTRTFGAYQFMQGVSVQAGFVVKAFGDWRLRCCAGGDLQP